MSEEDKKDRRASEHERRETEGAESPEPGPMGKDPESDPPGPMGTEDKHEEETESHESGPM